MSNGAPSSAGLARAEGRTCTERRDGHRFRIGARDSPRRHAQ